MKITSLSINEALAEALAVPFAYIACLSHVHIGLTPETVDLAEVNEARFFGENGEIRFFRENGTMTALRITDDPQDVTIDRTHPLIKDFGAQLTERRYIHFDQDGQGYIAATRLLAWKGACGDGD